MKKRKRDSLSGSEVQKWLLNLVIFCLTVVVVGFIFSMISKYTSNKDKINLSTIDEIYGSPEDLIGYKRFLDTKVEVLNGCGVNGLAHKFSNFLRKEGFDVLYIGNADRMNYSRTLVIDRGGDSKKLAEFLKVMKLDRSRVVPRKSSDYNIDISIILGRDYKDLPVYNDVLSISEEF